MKIVKNKKVFFIASISLILIGLIFGLINGFNFGIDFTGGTMLTIPFEKSVSESDIRSSISEFKLDETIQFTGVDNTEVIIRTKKPIEAAEREKIRQKIIKDFSLSEDIQISGEQFGPNIGAEISNRALYSILIASIGMLIYIWIRFKLDYAFASIIALIHDVLIVLGIYAIFQIQINSNFIAAMLTIVGYSINDTIVIFDRIRDNEKIYPRNQTEKVISKSIEQSLSRTILTSLTTLIVIAVLYFVSDPTIKEFALPIISGIIVGTYSSIFIAGPTWGFFKKRFKR